MLVPDRLLLTELALYGQFKQVPQVLWFRRWYGRIFSLGRQRTSFFPDGRPLYAYVPWWISHARQPVLDVHRPRAGAAGGVARRWRRGRPCSASSSAACSTSGSRCAPMRDRILEQIVGLRPDERRVRLMWPSHQATRRRWTGHAHR